MQYSFFIIIYELSGFCYIKGREVKDSKSSGVQLEKSTYSSGLW